MKLLNITTMVVISLIVAVPLARAESNQDTQTQIEALQGQIESMQTQLNALKGQMVVQQKETKDKDLKIAQLEDKVKPWFEKGFKSGAFKLRDAVGLDEESPLNISGEVAMQFKEPTSSGSSSDEGFRFYEVELFFDATLTENISVFAEYPIIYENGGASMEDAWIDIHFADELAGANSTGLKIGQFHTPFGWDNDDNEGYVYGGRTSVDSSLVRSERLDGQRLRTRQIGLQGNYNLDLARALNLDTEDPLNLIASLGVFNGDGPAGSASEWDSDTNKDVVARLEGHFLNAALGGSYWYSPLTKGATANSNNTAHIRDIDRYGVHFKYPDVPFPGEDISLGGSRYLIWGEYIWSKADASDLSSSDTDAEGGYVELDVGITPKLLGFFRYGYYDPNDSVSNDKKNRYTIGAKWQFADVSELTLDWQIDDYEGSSAEGGRFAAMYKVFF